MKFRIPIDVSLVLSFAAACAFFPTVTRGEDASENQLLKSGLQEGYLPPFHVTKLAGAPDDGVDEGESLCYRCRNASRPQVVVFTRSGDASVVQLLKRLDAAMERYEEDQLRVFVNVLAKDEDSAQKLAAELLDQSQIKRIPLVLPEDTASGPESYQLNPASEFTITFAADGYVVSSRGYAKASVISVDEIVDQVAEMLGR